jgi:integrase
LVPRFIRLRDAPSYLGMDKNRFNRDVRPLLDVIPIGSQGIAFDRLDLPRPVTKMNNTAWKAARERAAEAWAKEHGESAPAGFRNIRVHDLKHTLGRRLRAAGVSFEDRQDLLGHRSGRITTHYSQAELTSLIEASEKVCDTEALSC